MKVYAVTKVIEVVAFDYASDYEEVVEVFRHKADAEARLQALNSVWPGIGRDAYVATWEVLESLDDAAQERTEDQA